MICTDKKMANRVAIAGALKMNGEGYTFKPFGAGGDVVRADGYPYSVVLPTEDLSGVCTCKFYKANQEFGVCKHTVWAGWQVAAAAEREAQQAWEDAIALEAEARMSAECPTRGTVADKYRWATS